MALAFYYFVQWSELKRSNRVYQKLYFFSKWGPIHWLTAEKGVHQFRFFLPTMRTPISIVVCSCMYAFLLKWDSMHTPPFTGVRIGSHLNRNTFMHEQTTIGIHEEEVPKLVYTLFWCKPVKMDYGVLMCNINSVLHDQ